MLASHPLDSDSLGAAAAKAARGDAGHPEVSSQQTAEAQGQQQQQVPPSRPAAAAGGRPPLPRSVPPSSATSSRASSPGRGLSAQPSYQTLSMNKAAQSRGAVG
jgi:hypothetical protein